MYSTKRIGTVAEESRTCVWLECPVFSLGELSKADEGSTAERHRGLMALKPQDDLRLVFWGFFSHRKWLLSCRK